MGLLSDLYNDAKGAVEKIPGVSALTGAITPKQGSTQPLQDADKGVNATTGNLSAAYARAVANPTAAPTMDTTTGAGFGGLNHVVGQQESNISQLQAQANGTAPSAADVQLKQQSDTNAAQAFGMAAAMGGRNQGAALQQAQRTAQSTQANTNQTLAAQRIQEQQQGQQNLSNALQTVGGEQATVGSNNQQAQLTNQGQNFQNQANLLSGVLTSQGQGVTAAGDITQADVNNAAIANNYKGGLWQAAGTGLTSLSDEREKDDIDDVNHASLAEVFEKLKPATFEYKDPDAEGAAPGERVGVMAQDLKKSRLGSGVVIEGKPLRLDVGNALGLTLAGLHDMQLRLKKLETGKLKMRRAA